MLSDNLLTSPSIQSLPGVRAPHTQGAGGRLQSAGPGGSGQADIKKAASEFESIFVAYLLKVMRETLEESNKGESGLGNGIYTELFDQEVARQMARRGILGIADMISRKLEEREASSPEEQTSVLKPQQPGSDHSRAPGEGIPDSQLPLHAPISSNFGMRNDPLLGGLRFHKGVDLAAPEGTAVRAVNGGEVIFAGFQPGYGNSVVIRRADGLETRYAHLGDDIRVGKGDVVEAEQLLGSVGKSGRSTGPHLHFEVIRRGMAVDPLSAMAE